MERSKKYSRKREAILECLRNTDTHPTADWIYAQLKPQIPNLSLGTVYRNLAEFKKEGTIATIGVVNGQERFDWHVEPHVHFICQHCGAVMDVDVSHSMDILEQQVSETIGGAVTGFRLSFMGYCPNCRQSYQSAMC